MKKEVRELPVRFVSAITKNRINKNRYPGIVPAKKYMLPTELEIVKIKNIIAHLSPRNSLAHI